MDALVYREFQSKTRQGGISDRGKNPARVSYSFCTEVRSRCLVELFRKYLFLGHRGSYHGPDSMFKLILSGSLGLIIGTLTGQWVNILWGYIEDMMKRGGVEGNFKNHSMKKSTCTRLFRKEVDPQLLKSRLVTSLRQSCFTRNQICNKKRNVSYAKCFAKGNGRN